MLFDVAALAAAFAAFGTVPPLAAFLFAYVIGQLGGLIPLRRSIGGKPVERCAVRRPATARTPALRAPR